jgi:hypothetical protein
MFDQAKLAVVAYGEVSGDTGKSTRTNSGIATTRLALGTYSLDLPVASQNQIGLQQFSDRDLIFVQPLNASAPIAATAVNDANNTGPYGAANAQTRKLVFTGSSATTAVDCDFSFLILRTLTPPTSDGPA